MIAWLYAGLLAAAPTQTSLPPSDWSVLAPLILRRPAGPSDETSAYVREQVQQGRCAAAVRDGAGWTLGVDVAVLVASDGRIRRVVPRAIHCDTVEQYAAGLVLSGARDNILLLPGDADRWYRTRLTFAWGA